MQRFSPGTYSAIAPTLPGRRRFLQGSGAALGAVTLGFGAGAARAGGTPVPTLVYLFLRGGMDGLSFVVPRSGTNQTFYAGKRDRTYISPSTDNEGNGALLPLDAQVGLHPWCGALHQLFTTSADARLSQKLAVVLAAGHPAGTHTRSHFDAQEQIELGTPGDMGSQAGWLARYLQTMPGAPDAVFTALASSSNPPTSIGGWPDVATIDAADSFHPNTGRYDRTHMAMLRALYGGSAALDVAATATLDAVELVQAFLGSDYIPTPGVTYPSNSGLASDLRLVAQLVKQDLGIQVATVDVGGWDDHNRQDVFSGGGFGGRVRDLSDSLTAFFRDLATDPSRNYAEDVVVVVQSEFGRQVTENANQGTDHGLACPMLVLGGRIGGGVYGQLPNLQATSSGNGDSVVPTIDFRHVLASAAQHVGCQDIDLVFPPAFAGDTFLTDYGNAGPLGFA